MGQVGGEVNSDIDVNVDVVMMMRMRMMIMSIDCISWDAMPPSNIDLHMAFIFGRRSP